MEVLTKIDGLTLIVGYFIVMMMIVLFLRKREKTKEEFLVANRSASWILTSFSMAATWIWAPALFVAAEKAYTQGIVGVFWFVVPNVLTLVLFAFFANKMRKLRPEGWTFSDYIREKYSNRTHNLFLVESFGLQVFSLAVQLLAGAVIFSKITGLPFTLTTLLLALLPLTYTFISGIRSSIITDFWKMAWIVIVLLLGLPFMFSSVGPDALIKGLGGISGDFTGLFSGKGLLVTLSFGIPTTIGLLSGTFGDQMFWQRVFCVKADKVKKTMITAAVIFAVVPVSLALFGLFAAGAGLSITDTQLVNVSAVIEFCPRWFLYLFFVLILSGLVSTVDSILCAVSSVAGHDVHIRVYKKYSERVRNKIFAKNILQHSFWEFQVWIVDNPVKFGRLVMVTVAFLAILIANIPGITILYLFLFYGTLRSSVMLPTIFAIKGIKMSEKGLYYGLLTSMCIGLPIFAIANLTGNVPAIVFGSLFTILASGLIAVLWKEKGVLRRGPIVVGITIDPKLAKSLKELGEASIKVAEAYRDFNCTLEEVSQLFENEENKKEQ